MLSILELDPKSVFYRLCPGCGKPHMVKNRGRDYCSPKCYQSHYYTFKKNLSSFKLEDAENSDKLIVYAAPERNLSALTLKNNIVILQEQLADKLEISASIESLASKGFDFFAFSYHYPLSKTNESYCLEYGQYETYLLDPSNIYIRTKK